MSFVVIVPGRRFAAFVVANGGSSRFGAAARDAITRAAIPAASATRMNVVPPISPVTDPAGAYRLAGTTGSADGTRSNQSWVVSRESSVPSHPVLSNESRYSELTTG